jgi:recombinational DNA repair ATPase RecF
MRIDRVVAAAFGPFVDRAIELVPGMNVLYGRNESGKSSWHAALYAALCGMRRGRGRPRADDQAFIDRHRPWDGDAWQVRAVVTLEDGRRFELSHDLDGGVDARITDLGTGDDVSSRYIHDGAPDGAGLLGLTRDVLPLTVFVRQADILSVTRGPEALQQQLQRAAASGGGDATAEEALGIIEEYRSEHVGTEVRHSTKPLRAALDAVAQREAELGTARAQHREYVELRRRAREAETRADEARTRLSIARALIARKELAEEEARLERAESLAEEMKEGLREEPGDELPGDLAGRFLADEFPGAAPPEPVQSPAEQELRDALAAFRNRPAEKRLPGGRTAADIEAELAGLPDPPAGDTEVHPSVAGAVERYRARLTALETERGDPDPEPEPVETGGATATELRRLADELDTPVPEVAPGLREALEEARSIEARGPSTLAIGAGAVLAVVGAALIAAGLTGAGAGGTVAVVGAVALVLAVALVVWSLLNRPQPDVPVGRLEARLVAQEEARRQAGERVGRARDRVAELGLQPSPDELRQLARRLESFEEARERHARWRARVEEREAALDAAADAVRNALAARGEVAGGAGSADDGSGEGSLEMRVVAYLDGCRARADQARRAARRDDLERELEARRDIEAAHAENRRARAGAATRLREAAEAVGVEASDAVADAAEAWLRSQERKRQRLVVLRERWARLEGILQGRSLASLRASVTRLRDRLPPMPVGVEGRVDEVGGVDEARAGLEARTEELEAETHRLGRKASELRGRASDRARGIPDVAAAEEAYEVARAELRRVRELDRLLDRTHQFLDAARDRVQREIAPRLRDAIERHLASVTGGRYHEALVNADTLNVRIRPEGGDWRDAALLSHGTAEQVYLLLRIALAEHLAALGEPAPLVLDDVTVQCDAARTCGILDLLLELSRDRQIVLFSQENEVLEWAETRLAGERDTLVRLGEEAGV